MTKNKVPTRTGFGNGLLRLVEQRDDILVTAADTYRSFAMQDFVSRHPDRYFEFGIAEQNMMAASAAMATEGYTVFTVGYSAFLSMRALEQMRTFVAYPNLNVKVVAGLSGLSGGTCGVTHQGTEDIPIVRSIPNFNLVYPADAVATEKLLPAIAESKEPFYIKLGRSATPVIYSDEQEFTLGKAVVPREYGCRFVIVATGVCVCEAVEAADILHSQGIDISVIDMHTIKPLDLECIRQYAQQANAVLTVEDGSIHGGLGSAVAEVIADEGISLEYFKRLGLHGFGTCGSITQLLEFYHLDARSMVDIIRTVLS